MATICPSAIKQVGGSLFGGGRLMPGQQWPEMHTDPYHPRTHTSCALTPAATSDVTVTASRCPICHFEALWEWCMLPWATLFFLWFLRKWFLQMYARGMRFISHFLILRGWSLRSLFFPDSLQSGQWRPCSHLPPQPLEGVSGWQCLGFILGTWLLFILAHSR